MPQRGSMITLKDISVSDQETMGLIWAWEAGAPVTYIRPYGFEYHDGKKKSCSLVEVYHISNEGPRELWVFDIFLKATCIWNS